MEEMNRMLADLRADMAALRMENQEMRKELWTVSEAKVEAAPVVGMPQEGKVPSVQGTSNGESVMRITDLERKEPSNETAAGGSLFNGILVYQ
jgi:hypothetical protein